MIELKNVSKVYRLGELEIKALNDVSLKIGKGELLSIVGPSGSGKSTLLNIIGCIDVPTHGQVILDDRDISGLSEKELTKVRLHKIGFIFQQFYLIPALTALENVELPMKEAGLHKAERKKKAKSILSQIGMEDRVGHYPHQLSGGEQQRVAIARSLANDPELLLADEPTGEVDTKTSDRIVDTLEGLNRDQELTVIIVTHDPRVAARTNRIITLEDGKVHESKTVPECV